MDSNLVARVRAGDKQALGEYIEANRGALVGYIESRLGPALRTKLDADDILQEAAAEALRSISQVPLSDREPLSWLCQVAERRIIDAHRRYFEAQKRANEKEVFLPPVGDESAMGMDMLAASLTTASKAFSRKQKEGRLAAALLELPEAMRQALHLRYVEGLPSKEIAERLGKTDGAVRVMLTRSLVKLQALLGEG